MHELNFEFHEEILESPFCMKIIKETWNHIPQIGSLIDLNETYDGDDVFKVDDIAYLDRNDRSYITVFLIRVK